jgi:hypothetical protein
MSGLVETLRGHGDQLFGKRGSLLSLWQEVAENFYPERADFTTVRNLGDEMASNLMTSYPIIARRDLGNAFSAMLRPSAKDWFRISTNRPDKEDTLSKQWLEWASKLMKRAMYDRVSQFTRATKEADHDFAAFGQAVLSVEINSAGNGLLYRCWHLRDVAWAEDEEGKVSTVHRKWKPTATDMVKLFPKTVHADTRKKLEKDPYAEVNCRHLVLKAEDYAALPGAKEMRTPWVGVYIDCDHNLILEETGLWTPHYVVPRWQTVSGSQYAHSPATVAALPDARLLQEVSRVLLEAGEKATNPPMIAVQEAIRSDVAIYAGGITWVAAEYDERLGEVLRPMTHDKSGLAFGHEMAIDLRAQLADSWYLSKLNLPPVGGPDMTAYEVGQRVQEFIRHALPLFEPMENDYNGQLCEQSFELLVRNSPEIRSSVPKAIQGAEIQFIFESPLKEAIEKAKVGQFMEAQQVLAMAMQLDPTAVNHLNGAKTIRDVLTAVVPASWLNTEADAQAITDQQAQAAQAAQMLQLMQGGADVAKTLKDAGSTPGGMA